MFIERRVHVLHDTSGATSTVCFTIIFERGSCPKTYGGYSALHTQQLMYMDRESWAWNVNPSTLKISHSIHGAESGVLSVDCWVIEGQGPKLMMDTRHSTLRIHTPHSSIQIHWVLSVECWVSVIILGPGACFTHSMRLFCWQVCVSLACCAWWRSRMCWRT